LTYDFNIQWLSKLKVVKVHVHAKCRVVGTEKNNYSETNTVCRYHGQ